MGMRRKRDGKSLGTRCEPNGNPRKPDGSPREPAATVGNPTGTHGTPTGAQRDPCKDPSGTRQGDGSPRGDRWEFDARVEPTGTSWEPARTGQKPEGTRRELDGNSMGARSERTGSEQGALRKPVWNRREPHEKLQEFDENSTRPYWNPRGTRRESGGKSPGTRREQNGNAPGARQELCASPARLDKDPTRNAREPDGHLRGRDGNAREPDGNSTGTRGEPDRNAAGARRERDGNPTGTRREPDRSPTGNRWRTDGSRLAGLLRRLAGLGWMVCLGWADRAGWAGR